MTQKQEMTIDELALSAGVPSRTIREYQRLGLLPPPRRESRSGIYGEVHRNRLGVIDRLQRRGYSLAAIGDLLDKWEAGHGLGSVLGADANPAVLDEVPIELTMDELVRLAPCLGDARQLERLSDQGMVRPVTGDHERVVVRSLAAIELIGLAERAGMDGEIAIGLALSTQAGAVVIADAVVEQFVSELWDKRRAEPSSTTGNEMALVARRARLLLAQASASLVVDRLGAALLREAGARNDPGLRDLIEEIRIGALRSLPAPEEPDPGI